METLELPVTEEREEVGALPADFAQQEMDLAAYKLWQDASRPIRAED